MKTVGNFSGANFEAGKKAKAVQDARREMCASLYEGLASQLEERINATIPELEHLAPEEARKIIGDVASALRSHAEKARKDY